MTDVEARAFKAGYDEGWTDGFAYQRQVENIPINPERANNGCMIYRTVQHEEKDAKQERS